MINKVGFIGAGGTGKTTTMNLLKTELPKMKSASRVVFEEENLKESDQDSWSEQDKWKLQKRIFERKIRQDLETPRFIADRTLADHLAYCLYRCHRLLAPSVLKSMEILVEENLRKYDLLFYFEVGLFEVAGDGIGDGLRDVNPGYQFTISTLIEGILSKIGVPCWWVPPGTPEERANFVIHRMQVEKEIGQAKSVLGNRLLFKGFRA